MRFEDKGYLDEGREAKQGVEQERATLAAMERRRKVAMGWHGYGDRGGARTTEGFNEIKGDTNSLKISSRGSSNVM